jgi:SAM-dependent methyltransferase
MTSRLFETCPNIVRAASLGQYAQVDGTEWLQVYGLRGDGSEYAWNNTMVSSGQLLAIDGQDVLDVGAGHGEVVRQYVDKSERNKGIALTAFDYSGGTNPHIVVGDMHRLDDVLPPNRRKFQVVISRAALFYSPDPLCVYEQMLNAVDGDGTITTDMFRFPNQSAERIGASCVDYLIESGHFVNAANVAIKDYFYPELHTDVIPDLSLRRISEAEAAIQLPVEYAVDASTGAWGYKLAKN